MDGEQFGSSLPHVIDQPEESEEPEERAVDIPL